MEKIPVVMIIGPTASGKTNFSLRLASQSQGEIVSVDSMQVYRFMDIGTAKPTEEERSQVPHHLIDIRHPSQAFSVAQFVEAADELVKEIYLRGHKPYLVGGTPLYVKRFIEGIFEGPPADWDFRKKKAREAEEKGLLFLYHQLCKIDPTAAQKIDPNDQRRIIRALEVYELTGDRISSHWEHEGKEREKYAFLIYGLRWPRETLYERINRRVEAMMEAGWPEEARRWEEMNPSRQAGQALGYREMKEGREIDRDFKETKRLIKRNTRRFAKRQLQWFGKFPQVQWIHLEGEVDWKTLAAEKLSEIDEFFSTFNPEKLKE